MNKAWRDRTGAEEEYKERSDKNQTVAQVNLNKENQALNMTKMDLETKLMLTNSNQKGNQRQRWNWERAIYGTRIGKDDRHFTCPHCKAAVRGGGGHIGATLEMFMLEGAQPKKSLAVTEDRDLRDQRSWIRSPEVQSSRTLSRQEELFYHQRGYDIKTHVSNNGNKQPLGGRNNYLPEQRNKPSHTNLKDDMVDNQPSNKDVQTEHAGALPNYQTQTVSCVNCQRTYEYGQPGYELRDESYRVHAKRTAVYEGFPKQNPLTGLKTERNSNENQNNMDMYGIHSAREQRSVIFDMERSEVNVIDVQNIKHERKGTCDRIKGSRKMEYCAKHMLNLDITGRSVRSKDHSKRHKKHLQFNSLLKVKLNLHPFKKSKIHLQKNSPDEVEQCDDREQTIFKTPKQPKNTSKHVKSKSNSQHESTEGMETSKNVCSTHKHKAKQTSHSFEKSLQSSKNKLTSKPIDTNGVVEGNLEEENSVQPKNKESYKQKKTTSKSKHQERLGGDHPKKSRPAEDEKTDLSQKITGGETKESSGASPSSNLSAYQSKSKESVGSSVQQVEQYTNQQGQTPITEEEHPCNLGDGVTLQRTLSYPQQSTALPLAEMESTSNFSNFPGQEVKSTVSQNTSAPYTAYGGNSQIQCLSKHGSLVQLPLLTNIPHRFPTYTGNAKSLSVNQHTQPLSQTVSGNINQGAMISSDLDQFPAPQLVGAFTQLAQGPGSFNGQNISHLFQGPGSLNGDNLSNKNSMNPILHEILASAEGSPRKIRLVIPENTTNRPTSALEKKIR
ncbi:uncharacterized protein LOC117594263 [Esox lucius]|nr:uncharacterized protein LOC117594263 [Esox lucius]